MLVFGCSDYRSFFSFFNSLSFYQAIYFLMKKKKRQFKNMLQRNNPEANKKFGERNGNPHQYSFWETPWTEESDGLQSMGSQRVRCDLATKNTSLFKGQLPLNFVLSLSCAIKEQWSF